MTTNHLAEVFTSITERTADKANMPLATLRSILHDTQACASEPTDVTYEEILASSVPCMWIRPKDARADRVILYFHGGCYVVGSVASHRKMIGHIAKASQSYALAVDYRLAPEHSFPAAVEDAAAAYVWLLDQGYKAKNIATAGDSAGGGLAVAAVLKMRQDGMELPGAIVTISPWHDMNAAQQTGSMIRNLDKDKALHAALLDDMATTYLNGASKTDPLASPLRADLNGLPPTYVVASKDETLYDDAVTYTRLARQAGVEVEFEEVVGMQHVHTYMVGYHAEADKTIASIGRWLQSKM